MFHQQSFSYIGMSLPGLNPQELVTNPYNGKSRPIFTFIEKDFNGCCGVPNMTNQNSQKTQII